MDFDERVGNILCAVQSRIDLALWAVSLVRGDQLEVIAVKDRRYGIGPGFSVPFADTFCSRMLSGEAPPIAPVVDEVPAYATLPTRATMPIAAYGGVPISGEDGEVYGALEGVDPSPQPAAMIDELPLLQTLGEVLGIGFEAYRDPQEVAPVQRTRRASLADPLTGLATRAGWEQFLRSEQARQATRDVRSVALVVTLEGSAADRLLAHSGHVDQLLLKVANTMVGCLSSSDLAARLDDQTFAALIADTDADAVADCILRRLVQEGIAGRVTASSVTSAAVGRRLTQTRGPTKSLAISPRTIWRWQRSGRRFVVSEPEEDD